MKDVNISASEMAQLRHLKEGRKLIVEYTDLGAILRDVEANSWAFEWLTQNRTDDKDPPIDPAR